LRCDIISDSIETLIIKPRISLPDHVFRLHGLKEIVIENKGTKLRTANFYDMDSWRGFPQIPKGLVVYANPESIGSIKKDAIVVRPLEEYESVEDRLKRIQKAAEEQIKEQKRRKEEAERKEAERRRLEEVRRQEELREHERLRQAEKERQERLQREAHARLQPVAAFAVNASKPSSRPHKKGGSLFMREKRRVSGCMDSGLKSCMQGVSFGAGETKPPACMISGKRNPLDVGLSGENPTSGETRTYIQGVSPSRLDRTPLDVGLSAESRALGGSASLGGEAASRAGRIPCIKGDCPFLCVPICVGFGLTWHQCFLWSGEYRFDSDV
jgi:hypothetical protein